jgi:nuclear protein localization family protein 4
LHTDRSKTRLVSSTKSKTIAQIGLNHGDLLYLTPETGMDLLPPEDEAMDDSPSIETNNTEPKTDKALPDLPLIAHRKASQVNIKEDDVDIELNSKDGMIPRQKDPRSCNHGENAGCVYCCPLPPYDEAYLKEQKIKHLSFHSYLKKLTSGVDKYVDLLYNDDCSDNNHIFFFQRKVCGSRKFERSN